MGVVGFSLFVLGIILIISYAASKKKNARCSAQTQGTLIDVFETENSNGSTGHSFTYSYTVDGVEYKLKSNAYTEASNVGDTLTIWYNPKKPKDAQPFHYETMKVYKAILFAGIASILIGIVLCFIAL